MDAAPEGAMGSAKGRRQGGARQGAGPRRGQVVFAGQSDGELPALPHWSDPPTGEVPKVVLDAISREVSRPAPGTAGRGLPDAPEDDEPLSGPAVPKSPRPSRSRRPRPGAPATARRASRVVETEAEEEDDEGWLTRLLHSSTVPNGLGSGDGEPDEAWERFERASRPDGDGGEEDPGPFRGQGAGARAGSGVDAGRLGTRRARLGRVGSGSERDPSGGRGTLRRWVTGIVAGVVVLGVLAAGPLAVEALAALIVVAAEIELGVVLRRSGRRLAVPVAILGGLAATVAGYVSGPRGIEVTTVAVVPAAFAWELVETRRRAKGPAGALGAVAHTVLAYAWVGLLWSFLALMVSNPPVARGGTGLLLGVLVMVVAYDAGAYLVGSLLGRHRLAPEVSPGKSVEGAIGGSVLALGLGTGVVGLFLHPWSVEAAGLVALVTVVLAPLGDLSESLVKREIGVKDTSGLLPGHGGLLDRVDGLLFVLPFAYLVTQVVLGH